ncbi:345R [Invertebrate iridescent virus Kaz2018]|nr:345R [Invertebrate iridescent virus Kaz2018]
MLENDPPVVSIYHSSSNKSFLLKSYLIIPSTPHIFLSIKS